MKSTITILLLILIGVAVIADIFIARARALRRDRGRHIHLDRIHMNLLKAMVPIHGGGRRLHNENDDLSIDPEEQDFGGGVSLRSRFANLQTCIVEECVRAQLRALTKSVEEEVAAKWLSGDCPPEFADETPPPEELGEAVEDRIRPFTAKLIGVSREDLDGFMDGAPPSERAWAALYERYATGDVGFSYWPRDGNLGLALLTELLPRDVCGEARDELAAVLAGAYERSGQAVPLWLKRELAWAMQPHLSNAWGWHPEDEQEQR